jgi:hypothetical protein
MRAILGKTDYEELGIVAAALVLLIGQEATALAVRRS